MTKDYTKRFKKSDSSSKAAKTIIASEPVVISVPRKGSKERKKTSEYICKQCYEINTPITHQQGSWRTYILWLAFIFAIPSVILWYVTTEGTQFILWLIVVAGSIFQILVSPKDKYRKAFEGIRLRLNMPYELKSCRACKHPNSMVKIDSREGSDALYWYTKKNGGSASADTNHTAQF